MKLEPGSRLQGTQDAFVVQAVHGEGGFGVTYRCQRERDAQAVIAKVLRMDRLKEWKSLELARAVRADGALERVAQQSL